MDDFKITFIFKGLTDIIQCNKNENIIVILKKISSKIKKDIEDIFFYIMEI